MADDTSSRINHILHTLPDAQLKELLDYAEYLAQKHGSSPTTTEPLDIKRPEQETVIEAIKRLTATYPMLDTGHLFHEAGELVTQHVMQGRLASEVIDDLEDLFRQSHHREKKG